MTPENDTNDGTASDSQDRGGGIQSVARALSILELFDAQRPTLTAVEVAELTGLNRATAYRFCQTLLNLGYLEDVGQRRFMPGLKNVSLARAALSVRPLPDLAMPQLAKLQHETGEAVNMAMLDDTEVVYVVRLLSDHLITLRLSVGSRLPAYATSLGRAILAFLPVQEAQAVLDRSELRKLTPNTVVGKRKLMAELAAIRERGYAVNDQELSLGLHGVAAPILDVDGRPLAAVNVSLPHAVADDHLTGDIAPRVQATARTIGELAAGLPR